MTPIVIKEFFSKDMMALLKFQVKKIKESGQCQVDNKFMFREYWQNHPLFRALHQTYCLEQANKLFGEEVKPSYSYLAMYFESKGVVPLHVDRPPCKYTIDVCLEQREEWPIFVNDQDKMTLTDCFEMSEDQKQQIKDRSTPYILQPGDALCYSGTDHPHWRSPIQEGNQSTLVFFHYVPINYQGGLV